MASPAFDYDALAKQLGAVSSTPAGTAPIDYDALAKQHGATSSAAPSNPQGYLSQVGTGLWNTVKGLAQVGVETGGAVFDPLNAVEHLKNLKRMVLDPQVDQAIKAADEWKKGNRSESVGHALAAVLPGVGPAAANIGEKLGNQDYIGAAADATVLGAAMVAPKVAGRIADAAPAVAESALKTAKRATGAAVDVVGGIDPAFREAAGIISPRAKHVLDMAARIKKARDAYAAAKAKGAAAAPEGAATPAAEAVAPPEPPPAAPPEAGTPPAPAPEPAPSSPPAGGKPAAAEIAAQLEASMRTEALTDYLVRNKVPAAMLDQFGPEQWDMVSRQAGVKPPTPENIQAIRDNLAQYEGASQITATTPAEAAAEFETKRAVRNKRKPKAAAPPADVEAQLADSLAKVDKGERPVAQVADEGTAKPTASEVRVNAFAERLAAERDISLADLGTIAQNPEALRYMDNLGRSLGISGSLAPGDVAQIVDRVKELRNASAPGPTTLRDLMQPKAPEPPAAAAPRTRRSKPGR